jgi:hypothetical protein
LVRVWVARLVVAKNLTAKESQIVEGALRGKGARAELTASGISVNTLKSRIRRALRKLDARSLREVRELALRGVT